MKHAKTHAYNAHRRRRRRISNSEMFSRVFIARSLLKKNEIIIIKIIQKNNKKKEREREREKSVMKNTGLSGSPFSPTRRIVES